MYPLMPMLERGGKQGGGRCHNSAKTGIFKNSVILQMKSSLAQQLSCCTCLGGGESADGSWGIGYCRW